MKFRYSIPLALMVTAILLATNAHQVFWFNKPSSPVSSVHLGSREFRRAQAASLLSPSKYSRVVSTKLSQERLTSALAAAVPATSCVEVFSTSGKSFAQEPITSLRADDALIPASTNKLFTSAVVLTTFDPDDTLPTSLIAEKKSSNLSKAYVQTSGDPSFVTSTTPPSRRKPYFSPTHVRTFDDFAQKIYAGGVRSIGNLVVDTSWWDLAAVETGWVKDKNQVGQIAALNVDEGFDGTTLVSSPREHAAGVLQAALSAKGITVNQVSFNVIPVALQADHVIATTTSAPVKQLVSDMLATSDNVWAEQLLASAVHKASGEVTVKSRNAHVEAQLTQLNIPLAGYIFKNAAGYSREARATCALELDVVEAMQKKGIDLTDMASHAKQSGTLTARFASLTKPLVGKTGTLNGVTALTGTYDNTFTFSFISNANFSDAVGRSYQDAVVGAIAAFPSVSDPIFK